MTIITNDEHRKGTQWILYFSKDEEETILKYKEDHDYQNSTIEEMIIDVLNKNW